MLVRLFKAAQVLHAFLGTGDDYRKFSPEWFVFAKCAEGIISFRLEERGAGSDESGWEVRILGKDFLITSFTIRQDILWFFRPASRGEK
jgi:hypothetical protein